MNKATTNQIPGNAPLRSIQKHAQEMGSDGDVNLGQNNEDSQDTDIFHDTIAEHDQNEVQDDDKVDERQVGKEISCNKMFIDVSLLLELLLDVEREVVK